jgi:hypothetical protein
VSVASFTFHECRMADSDGGNGRSIARKVGGLYTKVDALFAGS